MKTRTLLAALSFFLIVGVANAMLIDNPTIQTAIKVFGNGLYGTTATTTIKGDLGTSTFSGGVEGWTKIMSPYFVATSTTVASVFVNATTTQHTNTGAFWLPSLTTGYLSVDANGLVYKTASTTYNAPLTFTGNAVSIAAANGSTNGYLTSGDWTTFNGKQASISATWPITLSGATVGFNGLSTSTAITIGQLPYWTGVNTLGSVGTSTLTPSSPLTGSFTQVGSGGSLGCQTASGSQAGCLSSADWTTFNNKAGFAFPWTPTTNFGVNTNATSTIMSFLGGLNASSTSHIDTSWFTGGKVGIASTSPAFSLGVQGAAGIDPFGIGSSTGTLFAVNQYGGVQIAASQPATSTTIVLDWSATPRQVEYRIHNAATSVTLINATTSQWWGSTKIVYVCNSGSTAGALTWGGVEWVGTAPTQTTTANQCDVYSFDITHATSSTSYKVAGTQGAGLQ